MIKFNYSIARIFSVLSMLGPHLYRSSTCVIHAIRMCHFNVQVLGCRSCTYVTGMGLKVTGSITACKCCQLHSTFYHWCCQLLLIFVWDVVYLLSSRHFEVKIKQHQFKVVVNLINLTMYATSAQWNWTTNYGIIFVWPREALIWPYTDYRKNQIDTNIWCYWKCLLQGCKRSVDTRISNCDGAWEASTWR